MNYKLGRYKFKHCRWSEITRLRSKYQESTFVCTHGTPCGLMSRRECDACTYFEPKDRMQYMIGLPEERKSQESYNRNRR